MNLLSVKLHLATVTVMSVFSHEVTVNPTDLKPCEDDDKVCVTDVRDCGPRPSASIQKTLNMSCYYQISHRSMTCEWSQDSNSHIESHVSLIFSSRGKVFCRGIFNPSAFLTITAKVKNYMTGNWEWSQPHDVFLSDAVKPPQPELTVSGSTDDSVTVSWKSHSNGSCRLRYRVEGTHTWSQAPESVPAYLNQMLVYTIKDLLPFTVYRAAVACREESDTWSNWSTDVTMRTRDRVPSGPPEVCYRLQRTDSGGPVLLHLLWKVPDPHDAGGRILGYQVSYRPERKQQLQDMSVQNITEETAPLMVEEGNWSITVAAFNTAGYGPTAHVSIDTHSQTSLPPVRDLWVSSSSKGLQVQWQRPPPSTPPVTHFTVRWSSETGPSTHHWATVDGFLNSTVIPDVDPEESYQVTVFPVSMQQCGPPQSVPASLQQGALIEADSLKVVGRTKTTVAVEWVWQRKSGAIRVDGYSVELRRDSDRWTVPVWPDQWQHTFINLKPSTEYSLHLLADNVSRSSISSVTTCFDEVPVVATATPLLLLALTVFIISILSRTVYKWYFFPPISSPQGSTTGRWLMDPNQQKPAGRNILDIKDFQVTDVLGVKNVIVVVPKPQPSSQEDQKEDASLLPLIKLSSLKLDSQCVSDPPVTTEHQIQSRHPDYTVKCRHVDSVFISEENQEAAALLLPQTPEAHGWFSQGEDQNHPHLSLTSPEAQTDAVKCHFHHPEVNTDVRCVYQMSCEEVYVTNASFLGKTDANCSYLTCDPDYIANSCFALKTLHADKVNNLSAMC